MRCCKLDISLAPTCAIILMDSAAYGQKCPSLSLDGLPLLSASGTENVSRNFSANLRTALRRSTGVSGNFSANCSYTKSVYLLPFWFNASYSFTSLPNLRPLMVGLAPYLLAAFP
jgi:hypothetical protein